MSQINFKRISANVTGKIIPAAGGGVAGVFITKLMSGGKMKPALIEAIKLGAAAVLPELSPKTKMLEPASHGLAGQASGELFKVIMPGVTTSAPDSVDGIDGIGADEEYIVDAGVGSVEEYPISGEDSPIQGVDDDEFIIDEDY